LHGGVIGHKEIYKWALHDKQALKTFGS